MQKNKLFGNIAVQCPNCRAINLHPASGPLSSECPSCGYRYPIIGGETRGSPSHGKSGAKRMSISIPLTMHKKIKASAEENGVTPSAIVRAAVACFLQVPE